MPQNPPAGVPRILARVTYDDVAKASAYLGRVFGFSEDTQARYFDDTGSVSLTEICVFDSRIMVGGSGNHGQMSPNKLDGANTQMLVVYVDDVDEHHQRSCEFDAEIVMALNDAPWGDRRYEVLDCEGHRWAFHQHMR